MLAHEKLRKRETSREMREKVGLNDDDVKRLFSKNVRFEVTDVSTRLQGCPSRVSSFRFLPLVREEAGALHVGQAHRRVIQDRQLRHQVCQSGPFHKSRFSRRCPLTISHPSGRQRLIDEDLTRKFKRIWCSLLFTKPLLYYICRHSKPNRRFPTT